jgi:CheY-like chemotaxis protein
MNDASRSRILVVDDDPDLAEVVMASLELGGYDVLVAHHGVDALEKMKGDGIDLVLLDMRMPVMDGWEFARRLHANRGHDVPIIVVTAAENAREWASEVQAEGYLAKPFAIEDLLSEVETVVASHSRRCPSSGASRI